MACTGTTLPYFTHWTGDCMVTTVNFDALLSGIKVDCLVSCRVILLAISAHIQTEKWASVQELSDRMKIEVKTFLETSRRHSREVEVRLHSLLTSAVDGWQWSTSSPHRFTTGGRFHSSLRTEGWAGLTAEIDISKMEKKKKPLTSYSWI